MQKSTLYKLIAVLCAFIGMITVGGLGNAAASISEFYLVPALLNVVVYVFIVIAIWKKAMKEEYKEIEEYQQSKKASNK